MASLGGFMFMPISVRSTILTLLFIDRDSAYAGRLHAVDSDDRDYYSQRYSRAVAAIAHIESLEFEVTE